MTTQRLSRSLVFFHQRHCQSHLFKLCGCTSSSSSCSNSLSSSFSTSSSGSSDPLSYLRTWVGSGQKPRQQAKQRKTNTPTTATPHTKSNTAPDPNGNKPLLLTGSSYLMPTLRLERYDTPQSIQQRLDYALNKGAVGSVRTMLGMGQQNRKKGWVVPIVLDLSSFQPDGSPHYKPPPAGALCGFVDMLRGFHICVVGVANPPSVSTMNKTPDGKKNSDGENKQGMMSMEKEAMVLGLPSIMPRGRAASGGGREMVIHAEDVIQLVLDRIKEESDGELEELSQMQKELYSNVKDSNDDDSEKHNEAPDVSASTSTMEMKENIASEDDHSDPQSSTLQNENDDIKESQQPTEVSPDEPVVTQAPPPPPPESTLYHGSVRSGQQVTSKPNQSLIILGSVNSGGEALSDGDIYVFGKLRGRALAGLAFEEDGDKKSQARIFATNFDPELVCIGNTFTTVDDVHNLVSKGGRNRKEDGNEEDTLSVMVSLDDHGELSFEPISL